MKKVTITILAILLIISLGFAQLVDVEGNVNISNSSAYSSSRTTGEQQSILTLDDNNDVVVNRGSIIDGFSSSVLVGLGENKRFLVRNSLNTLSLFTVDEPTGRVGIATSTPSAKFEVRSNQDLITRIGKAGTFGTSTDPAVELLFNSSGINSGQMTLRPKDSNISCNGSVLYYLGDSDHYWHRLFSAEAFQLTCIEPFAEDDINKARIKSGLQKLSQLSGVSLKNLGLEEGFALAPKTVRKYFPSLIHESKSGTIGINYTGFVPVIIEALKEQQVHLEEKDQQLVELQDDLIRLQNQNEQLEARLAKLETFLSTKTNPTLTPINTFKKAELHPNQPNPFTENTTLRYFIPNQVQQAALQIIDANGNVIKNIPITTRGEGQSKLEARALSVGNYFYSLVLDGKVLDTKQMILVE